MIAVQTIVDRCNAALDAEGSDRYIWSRDFVYAVNYANEFMVTLINEAFAANKLSEESLKELSRVRIWQTSLYSRVAFDSTIVGDSNWTILAVYPSITTIPSSPTIATATAESVYRSDVSFRSAQGKAAKRLTREEWAEKDRNPFVSGSSFITNTDLIDYAYTNFADYTGGYSLSNDEFEIEIAPSVAGNLVAISYLKKPTSPTLISEYLEFPDTLTDMIVEATLNYISYKQGNGTNLYQVTQNGIAKLASLIK